MILAALLFAVMTAAVPPVSAQGNAADATDLQALRAAARADKKALVASMLQLTDLEAKKFWPLYDAYQRKVDTANRERALVVEDLLSVSKPISDLYAKSLAKQMVEADETEVRARRTLYNGLMRALPATKAARYLQLEAKIRAVQGYDMAGAFPLVK
jgi:outer membrane PBP1 activator LpoA protein